MKTSITACAALAAVLSSAADVVRTDTPPVIDGKLDEACWAKADWNGGFVRFANNAGARGQAAPTEFAVLSDDKTLYVGVKCFEHDMAAVQRRMASQIPSTAWTSDAVEVFLCPTGKSFDFYQFAVPYDERISVEQRFASEGGNITPDPYSPEWQAARSKTDQGWFAEIAIPLSSFYMTRNDKWSDEWLVNVSRWSSLSGGRTTWSPLERSNTEPERFRRMHGFPTRAAADDVGMTDFVADMRGRLDGKLTGSLSFEANVAQGGEYEVSSPFTTSATVSLKPGKNVVRVQCAYPENGRYDTRVELRRKATGETYARMYPVVVDFEDVRLFLTSPEYRDNFYPGQDASRVSGRVRCAAAGEVTVTLEGPGFQRREARLPAGGGEIDFDTRGFKDGTAVLSVVVGTARREFKIRKLAKTGRRMAWISKGRLVVDGRPVLRRGVYAKGYRGGKAFDARFAAEGTNLFLSACGNESGGTLEPNRVIKGLEAKEARKDVVPCREYFDKIDAMIEKSRSRDFVYWYISDEPECRGISPVYLRHIYEHMKEKDPYHVILTASRGGKKYIDCADWFETHPYLCPYDDGRGNRKYATTPSRIGEYLDAFEAWDRPDKCIGFLPTMFAYRFTSLQNDYPTFAEYVCHVWAAMVRGGKTLWPYAYHDMGDRASIYEGNRYVNSTFAALEDFILDGKRTTLLRSSDAECARWDLEGGASMFALVNFTAKSRTVAVPGLAGTFREFRGDRTFTPSDASRGFAMRPFEVLVGTTDRRGEGLPTYAETSALVDRMEHERTHRDNQLLEKYADVGFASSGASRVFYKLIDGVRDMYAWGESAPANGAYVEFSFPDKPIRFSRVRVYGSGIDGMGVSIRKGGEWKSLKPKNVTTGEWMRELDFGAVETTVKIRVSFSKGAKGAPPVELYEVEIPAVPEGDIGAASAQRRETLQGSAVDALWTFDESNADWSAGYSRSQWMGGKGRTIEPRPDGGFRVSGIVCHLVELRPDYPWLELEADSFAVLGGGKSYRAWSLHTAAHGLLCGTVTHPQTGLYTIRMPQTEEKRRDWLKLYDYNLDMGVRRLRNVKRPPNLLSAEVEGGGVARPGARLRICLELDAPCEDVTAVMLCDREHGGGLQGFAVNGTNSLDMKATDRSGRRWEAVVDVRKCAAAKPRRVYVKCLVLGGALKTPVFTNFTSAFAPEAQPETGSAASRT